MDYLLASGKLITFSVWIIMGCISCLYTEITWKIKRDKVIEKMSKNSSPANRDIVINILDNYRYIVVILMFAFAPYFFLVTMKDIIELILGKSELQK